MEIPLLAKRVRVFPAARAGGIQRLVAADEAV